MKERRKRIGWRREEERVERKNDRRERKEEEGRKTKNLFL